MTTSLARFISFIFNPILLLVFIPFFLLLRNGSDLTRAFFWTGYTSIFLLMMTVFLAYCVKKHIITDMDVSKRTQRPLVFLVSSVLIVAYLISLYFFHGPRLLSVIAISVMIGVALASIINLRLKASMHVSAISALIFALAIVYNGYYLLLLFLIPTVAWARLKIKRHTLSETVVGGLLGVLLSLCIYALTKVFT